MLINLLKLIKTIGVKGFISDLYISFIRNLDGRTGFILRNEYYKKRLKHLGQNVLIDTGVYFTGCEFISIGNNTHIDKGVIIVGSSNKLNISNRIIINNQFIYDNEFQGQVNIGNDCHISQNAMIYGYYGVKIGDFCTLSTGVKLYSLTSHYKNIYDDTEIVSVQPYSGKSPTIIGEIILCDNVWLGIDVIVNPGVKIGENSFVKSKTILTKSFNENSVIEGNPNIVSKKRFNY